MNVNAVTFAGVRTGLKQIRDWLNRFGAALIYLTLLILVSNFYISTWSFMHICFKKLDGAQNILSPPASIRIPLGFLHKHVWIALLYAGLSTGSLLWLGANKSREGLMIAALFLWSMPVIYYGLIFFIPYF
jgi:hypothetical protein